jgi:hypothetical protein
MSYPYPYRHSALGEGSNAKTLIYRTPGLG